MDEFSYACSAGHVTVIYTDDAPPPSAVRCSNHYNPPGYTHYEGCGKAHSCNKEAPLVASKWI